MTQKCHNSTDDEGKKPLALHKNKIAIVGLTNVGKSILFNKFSNSYSLVANYPQTTISVIRKDSTFAGEPFEIIDTPGIASLSVFSEDERVTRDILVKEHPELLLFCADATRLKQSLILLAQIFELEIPTIFCLNMMDEASRKGIMIDSAELAKETGSPVAETAAVHGIGLRALENMIYSITLPRGQVRYTPFIEQALEKFVALFSERDRPSRALLLLYLMGDEDIARYLESGFGGEVLFRMNEILLGIYRNSSASRIRQSISSAREAWAEKVTEKSIKKAAFTVAGFSHKAAWASRHIILGWPILAAILWATFYGVGTVATMIAGNLDAWIFAPLTGAISSMVTYPFLNEFLVGGYGILTMGIFNAIGTVVPILIVFFTITNFLEDVGYLPNLSVLANRFLSYFGLTGKAVLPLVLGYGCNTVATLTTRMLATKKERMVASFLIALGVPCAVQLGVLLAIMATSHFSVLLITMAAVIGTQIVCGIALNRLFPTERKADFIMELPAFHLPSVKHIALKTYYRVKWFLVEAVPLFVLGAALLFAMEKTGLLSLIKVILKPVVTGFLFLPDKMTEVFILVLSRRELGAVFFKHMVDSGEVDYCQTIVGLVVTTLFIPCISNTMVMVKELGAKWAIFANVLIIIIAVLVGGLVNFLIRFFL